MRHVALAGIAVCGALLGCQATRAPEATRVEAFGDPRPGLTVEEMERFEAGKALFDRIFAQEEGLGPLFNENQCSACHTDPAQGGTGEQLVRKASTFSRESGCDPLIGDGGENLRKQVTALGAATGAIPDTLPSRTTHVGLFNVPFLFGLGGAERVADATLLALADPDDRDGDGISGVVGRTPDGRVGRFGRKADVATLGEFTTSALLNEMGLTSPAAPEERGVSGGPLPQEADPARDPEVSAEMVDRLTDFVRLLGVPPRATSRYPARAARGEELFEEIGCSALSRSHPPDGRRRPVNPALLGPSPP